MQERDSLVTGDASFGHRQDGLLAVPSFAPPDRVVPQVGHYARQQNVVPLAELPRGVGSVADEGPRLHSSWGSERELSMV